MKFSKNYQLLFLKIADETQYTKLCVDSSVYCIKYNNHVLLCLPETKYVLGVPEDIESNVLF